jgi:hypothetical protein
MTKKNIIFLPMLFLCLYGCNAVPICDRFKRTEEQRKSNDSVIVTNQIIEDFDFSAYKTVIKIEDNLDVLNNSKNLTYWTNYSNEQISAPKTKLVKVPGYRVQVFTSDNLEEINNLKTDLYFKTSYKNIYLIFDSPNYKIKIGDFSDPTNAKELNFKLNQLGYKNCIVVSDSINIYK